ncbi:MAG: hypothetical protein FWH37_08565 [Candidatus Bathyarchaeota archaeon]|nr:hypothetical protein [Candidatus Termiticorpusculum sp.]
MVARLLAAIDQGMWETTYELKQKFQKIYLDAKAYLKQQPEIALGGKSCESRF